MPRCVHRLHPRAAREERVHPDRRREQVGREHVPPVIRERRERGSHVGQRALHEPRERLVVHGEPLAEMADSETPVGPPRQAIRALPYSSARRCCLPRITKRVGSHDQFSRLNRTACTLAVYASQPRSPVHHARLASGWWPSLAGRDSNPLGSTVRFPLCSLRHRVLLTQASPSAPNGFGSPGESGRAGRVDVRPDLRRRSIPRKTL